MTIRYGNRINNDDYQTLVSMGYSINTKNDGFFLIRGKFKKFFTSSKDAVSWGRRYTSR